MKNLKSRAAAAVLVTAIIPQFSAFAVSDDDDRAAPVYNEFNKNDVNGTVMISVPNNAKASVFIGFTSPEVDNEPYYSEELSGGRTYYFDVEGMDNSDGDYRFYNLSVELTGGKYNMTTEKFTDEFEIPDGNDNPDSYRELTYNFTIDDSYSVSDTDIISVSGYEKNIAAHLDYLMQGDVNNDGQISPSDASYTLSEYAVLSTGAAPTFNSRQNFTADVDMNSQIDPSDASRILSYYAALSTNGSTEGIFVEPVTVLQ